MALIEELQFLYERAKFDELLDLITSQKNNDNLRDDEKINLAYYESRYYLNKSMYEDSLQLIQKAKKDLVHLQHHEDFPLLTFIELVTLDQLGRPYEDGRQIEKVLQDELKKPIKQNIRITFNSKLAWHFGLRGDMDKFFEISKESLALAEEIDDLWVIAGIYNNIGYMVKESGSISKSIFYLEKSREIYEQIGSQLGIALAAGNLGSAYAKLGRIEDAKKNFQLYCDYGKQINSESWIINGIARNGMINRLEGEIEKALVACRTVVTYYEKKKNEIELSLGYFGIINLLLTNNLSGAESYIDRLKLLADKTDQIVIRQRYNLAKAMYYVNDKLFRNRIKAIPLLEEIINSDTINGDLYMIALINLTELDLQELIITQDEQLLLETNMHIEKLLSYAQKNNHYPYIIQGLVLKSRLMLLGESMAKSEEFLEKALNIAEEHQLYHEIDRVKHEIMKLASDAKRWSTLINNKSGFSKKLVLIEIDDYITKAKNSILLMN